MPSMHPHTCRFVDKPPSWKATNKGLDSSQKAAVELALRAQDVALIHGPPGGWGWCTGRASTGSMQLAGCKMWTVLQPSKAPVHIYFDLYCVLTRAGSF